MHHSVDIFGHVYRDRLVQLSMPSTMDGSHRTDLGNYKRNWSHRARIEARTLRQTPESTIFSSAIMMQKHAASGGILNCSGRALQTSEAVAGSQSTRYGRRRERKTRSAGQLPSGVMMYRKFRSAPGDRQGVVGAKLIQNLFFSSGEQPDSVN